jgi:hypothetical protein
MPLSRLNHRQGHLIFLCQQENTFRTKKETIMAAKDPANLDGFSA